MLAELYHVPAFAPEADVTESEELSDPVWSRLTLGDNQESNTETV